MKPAAAKMRCSPLYDYVTDVTSRLTSGRVSRHGASVTQYSLPEILSMEVQGRRRWMICFQDSPESAESPSRPGLRISAELD